MGGQRQCVPAGDDAAQFSGSFILLSGFLRRIHPQLHTAGAYGGQQGMNGVGAEHEGCVGRALLYDLQQYVLIPFIELGTVGKQIDLPPALVGADVSILTQGADGFYRQLLPLTVLHLRHIGVDAVKYLAAGIALQTGASAVSAAQMGGRDIAGGLHLVSLAGEDHGMAQPAMLCRGADGLDPCGIVVFRLCHPALPQW